MVRPHDGAHQASDAQWTEDLGTDQRVSLHLGPLLIGQRARLEEHVLADADLPDVMEHGAVADGLDSLLIQPGEAGQLDGPIRHAAAMVLRRRVLGIDRAGEGDEHVLGRLQPMKRRWQPQVRADPGEQLGRLERLGDEVAGAGIEAGDLVLGSPAGGDQDDRQQRRRRGAPDGPGHFEAVHAGHADVE